MATLLVTAAAGCGSDGGGVTKPSLPGGSTTTEAPLAMSSDGLGATLEQYRPDQVSHTLQVQVTNRSGRAVRLGGVRLVWPGLVTITPSSRADLVSDGQTIDLTVDYGDAVCASPPRGDETPPDAPAAVEAKATWDDVGAPQPVVFPVTDRRSVLPRLFVPSCRRQSVTSVVTMAWSTDWADTTSSNGRLAGLGSLRLTRRAGAQPVRVTALRGSVVLTVEAARAPQAGAPLVTLGPDQAEAILPVVIGQAGSCADHVLSQSSQTFLLPVTVTIGDRPEIAIDVVPDVHAQNQLLGIASRACGNG